MKASINFFLNISNALRHIASQSNFIPSPKYCCNDLFSRFEQQILFLEKQAEATDPTTNRHGHDGPSQGLVSKHLENLKLGIEIDSLNFVTEWQDGPSQTLQRIESLNSVMEQQDGSSQARRPVTGWVIPGGVRFL